MKIKKAFTPKKRKEWRGWLEKHHDREQEVWLVYFKPASCRMPKSLRHFKSA